MTDFQSEARLYRRAMQDIGQAAEGIDDTVVDRIVDAISTARHVSVFGCGREGLQVRGFAMRLFHLGQSVSVVGEMVTPAIGKGDLFLVTAGPGDLATASALVEVAKNAGARVITITAQPQGRVPQASDEVLVIPAQTMANDRDSDRSLLPMGSVFEGALFVLFEVMILKLKAKLGVSDETMRSNHTNLE
ncbi:6-phospho-3-hexuloisomerase [Phyllobacterium myrsinacearum]|uniref:6-phospho-3-hexuloisomerase n=1 Tax=Phyllobacterium myrsinacearum TaxID=28101 RepID=A0A839EM08_9HYPH|nr:6-phospho-3-hexuloisomerase [Phyllobacterium myrsinacearum]MBA8881081.1 6-phospho-3-hexuloisomerase [Phyllobacterium myrsinacearum]